jgi:hypothetical protein
MVVGELNNSTLHENLLGNNCSMGIIAGLVCDIQRARVTKIDPMVLLRQQ